MAVIELTCMDAGVRFGHRNDERGFFEWLSRIPCVASFRGDGERGLVVTLTRPPRQDELRELLAFCHRYGIDMHQLSRFETKRNRAWFRAPAANWHEAVFGSRAVSSPVNPRTEADTLPHHTD